MGFGRNSHVAWVEEPVWGTAVTPPTKWGELISATPGLIFTREPRPVLRGLDSREGNLYDAKEGAEPTFSLEANYEGMTRLFEHVFGDASAASSSPDVDTRFEHVYTPQETIMAGKGLSLYFNTDLGGNEEIQIAGVKLNTMRLSGDPTRNLQIEFAGAGKASVDVATTTPVFPAAAQYVAGHQMICKIDATPRLIDSFELTFDNGLDLDKRVHGSKNIDEPIRGDANPARVVTGTITMDAVLADLSKLRAGTLFQLEFLHTGAVLEADFYRLDALIPKCQVTDAPYSITGPGIVKSVLPFRALLPTAGELITLTVSNTETVPE